MIKLTSVVKSSFEDTVFNDAQTFVAVASLTLKVWYQDIIADFKT